MKLDRVDGPECPECGCQQTEVLKRVKSWGKLKDRRRCEHCGKTFDVLVDDDDEEEEASAGEAPVYQVIRCPKCASDRVRVTTTRKPIRHHKCAECGHRFKSCEHGRGSPSSGAVRP